MKKLKLILVILTISFSSHGQFIAAYAPTITPQNPIFTDIVRVITHVMTPHLGIKLYSNTSWDLVNKKIYVSACYWDGQLTMPKDFFDTTTIGPLYPGVYQFNIKLYSSTTNPNCNKSDSAIYNYTITISPNSVIENKNNQTIRLHPNPTQDKLFIELNEQTTYQIHDLAGRIVLQSNEFKLEKNIDVSDLPKGIYFLHLRSKESSFINKFIKE